MLEDEVLRDIAAGSIDTALERLYRVHAGLRDWVWWNLSGAVAVAKGNTSEAERNFRQAVRLSADSTVPNLNLASLLSNQGRYKEALPFARSAFRADPQALKKNALVLLHCLLDSAQIDEALRVIESLPASDQTDRKIRLARAACLRQRGNIDEAELILAELMSTSEDIAVLRMLADLQGEQGKDPMPYYERALSLAIKANDPGQKALKWNMSLHLLRRRDFKRGWAFYEEGLKPSVGTLARNIAPQFWGIPRADLKPKSAGDWCFVVVEQGIGDQVLFLSAFDELLSEWNGQVVLICEARLMPIVQRSFPSVICALPGLIEYFDKYRFPFAGYIPIGSILGRYRTSQDEFVSQRKPFLKVAADKYKKYRSALKEAAKGKPIVGISWKGGYWENQQRNKATTIEDWEAVFQSGAFVVNLQYGDTSSDEVWIKESGYAIYRFEGINFKEDLDDWLAIAAACDGIISVSTALVHFAGACNQKVAVVMPQSRGPWVLGINDIRSMVYPNVYHYRILNGETPRQLIDRVVGEVVEL